MPVTLIGADENGQQKLFQVYSENKLQIVKPKENILLQAVTANTGSDL
jgi:hypothetical protein